MDEHKNKSDLIWIRPTSLPQSDSEEPEYYTYSESETSDSTKSNTLSQHSFNTDTEEDSYSSEVKASFKYKKVADKVKPVDEQIPEHQQPKKHFPRDPLLNLPTLSGHDIFELSFWPIPHLSNKHFPFTL